MFGYDVARLHAAVNDLAPVLLPLAVLFDLLGAYLKRESLKAAGFWTLLFGVAGGGLAIITGLLAEDATPHSSVQKPAALRDSRLRNAPSRSKRTASGSSTGGRSFTAACRRAAS
jgi:uncharacterized membrane protein